MKKSILLSAILLTSNLLSAQWVQQNPNYPDTNVLNDLVFFDHSSGWAVGGYYGSWPIPSTNESLHTNNSGLDWNNTWWLGMGSPGQNVFFIDENYGWVCGGQEILHTTDGGLGFYSWESQNINLSPQQYLYLVFFIDSLNGWAYSKGGEISLDYELFKTTDGGNNWESQLQGHFLQLNDMCFLNESIGYGAGWSEFNYTIDGGDTWNIVVINMVAMSLDVIDENNIWIAGYDDSEKGIIKSSVDGGLTWNKKLGDTIQPLKDIIFIDSNIGWAVGDSGTILHTSDGGNNWEFQESGTSADLNSVYFVDENYGWICGDSSIILHTDNGGIVGTDQSVQSPGLQVQVYPNPFSDNINVEFELNKPSNVSIQILNNMGTIVWKNNLGIQSCGKNTQHPDIRHLASGVYFCKLQAGDQVAVERLVKL